MTKTFPGRAFQLWEYRVSHGMLLVRSPKDATHSVNVDVMLSGVVYVELPRHLPELELDEPLGEEVERARATLGGRRLERGEHVFVFQCQGRRHLVIAAGVSTEENELDIFDSQFAD